MGSRLDTNNDGHFDHEERRHLAEAMRDAKRYENSSSPRDYDDDDPVEFFMKFFLVMGVILFVALAGLFFGAEQLDSWFGWGLEKWLEDTLPFGNPLE